MIYGNGSAVPYNFFAIKPFTCRKSAWLELYLIDYTLLAEVSLDYSADLL